MTLPKLKRMKLNKSPLDRITICSHNAPMIMRHILALFLVVWISFTLSAQAISFDKAGSLDKAGADKINIRQVLTSKKINALAGPIKFEVSRVIDGDTYEGLAITWVDQTNVVRVRLRGVDTPELRGSCQNEKALGKRAKAFVDDWLQNNQVVLVNIEKGKYYRVVADIRAADGTYLSQALMAAGLGRPYTGGKRISWCAT